MNQSQLTAASEAKVAAVSSDGNHEVQDFTPLEIDGPTGWQQLLTTRRNIVQSGNTNED